MEIINMKNQDNQITKIVKEAILKTAKKGEDLKVKVTEITRDAVNFAFDKTEPTLEKIEAVTQEIMDGVIEGAKRG